MLIIGYLIFSIGLFIIIYHVISHYPELELQHSFLEEAYSNSPPKNKDTLYIRCFKLISKPITWIISKLPFFHVDLLYTSYINKKITSSGLEDNLTHYDFISFQLVTIVIYSWIGYKIATIVEYNIFISIVAFSFAGFLLQLYWLFSKYNQYQKDIQASIPDVVDALYLTVSAGLTKDSAIKEVCNTYNNENNPFINELLLVKRKVDGGYSETKAIQEMAIRNDNTDLYSFCSAWLQGEKTNISDILKSLSDRMRYERMIRAESEGQKASQTMLFPIVLLILPIFFLLCIYPMVHSIVIGQLF